MRSKTKTTTKKVDTTTRTYRAARYRYVKKHQKWVVYRKGKPNMDWAFNTQRELKEWLKMGSPKIVKPKSSL